MGWKQLVHHCKKNANLTAAVIDVLKSKNNNHNANQFFSTITESKNDLDPMAQIVARWVMQIRRTACKKKDAEERFQNTLKDYAKKHKKRTTMAQMVPG